MTTIKFSLAFVSVFTLMACASPSESTGKAKGIDALKDDVRLGEQVDKICFNRNIDGFSNAGRKTVILSSGVNKDYMVEVRGVCTNLPHAQSIGIDASMSCVRRGDYLIVSDSAFSLDDGIGFGPDRCYIDRIHKWDKKANRDKDES